ncbi:MAG: serine/threonine-protein kinase [Planctomycetaceae bacterium]
MTTDHPTPVAASTSAGTEASSPTERESATQSHFKQIGPYRIEHKIGAGGMGTVYLGTHTETGRQAAIKVLPTMLAREPGFVARFNREIDALKKLTHPNVVELYESGVDESTGSETATYYYAMEYVDGETLTSRLKREKRIPWRETIDIAVQICAALKAAHNAGVIHRDLKPSNLMLAKDGTVKLTDFGVAQVFASGKLTLTGGVIGTAEYMSPEQAEGKRATKQSDLYALGAVMYVMITGRPPFTGRAAVDIATKQKHGLFDAPRMIVPEIPYWLDEVICKCLEKRPENRYPDAYVLSRRLEEIPKKIDLAAASGTATFEIDAPPDAETLAADARPGDGDVGATLMRDLMRAQLEESQAPGRVSQLLDSVWVLSGLLLLVIAGGVWWFSRGSDPEKMFEAGEALMKKPEGPAWREARDRYFQPLIEMDPDTWESRVEGYLRRISLSEDKRGFDRQSLRPLSKQSSSEVARILRRARQEREAGETSRALQTLRSLKTLLPETEDYKDFRNDIDRMIDDINQEMTANSREVLNEAVTRAVSMTEFGQIEDARFIWLSIIDLYDTDPHATEAVAQARQWLEDHPLAKPSESETDEQPSPTD